MKIRKGGPVFFLVAAVCAAAAAEAPWRFIGVADWHGAEEYVWREKQPEETAAKLKKQTEEIRAVRNRFGGELVLLPGDVCDGHWDKPDFIRNFMPGAPPGESVPKAGLLCYSGAAEAFRAAGYERLLMAVGDHEVGDNAWPAGSDVSRCQPQFRGAFSRVWTRTPDGSQFLYNEPVGTASPRPAGTPYEGTSYALRHKNVLFVTVDVFHQESPDQVIGEEGTVTGAVTGKHLQWLDHVLSEARKDPSIQHIFVQAHLPVIHPVRKIESSGMLMDDGPDCEFWNTLRKYRVDIYFAGEVHANTVTKDTESPLLQVVTRGNYLDSLFTADISGDRIEITAHRLIGASPADGTYEPSGRLVIDKSSSGPVISGEGSLALFDPRGRLLHYTFEEEGPLKGQSPKVRGIFCSRLFPNSGVFGDTYDALYAGIIPVEGVRGKAALMDEKSRLVAGGMGPALGGRVCSYALWIKTVSAENQLLINTASLYRPAQRNFFNLNLNDGIPEAAVSATQTLAGRVPKLNDGRWHHIAVTMPADNCLLSEIRMYADGRTVDVRLNGADVPVSADRASQLSFGGLGNSHGGLDALPVKPFCGAMDEISVWARPLTDAEVLLLWKEAAL